MTPWLGGAELKPSPVGSALTRFSSRASARFTFLGKGRAMLWGTTRWSFVVAGLALMGCLCGCVFPGDIRQIQESQARYQAEVDKEVALAKAGAQSVDVTLARVETARAQRDAETSAVVAAVERRTDEAIQIAKGVADGSISLTGALTGTGAASLLTGIGIQLLRNRTRRRENGEILDSIGDTDDHAEELEKRIAELEKLDRRPVS